MDVAGSIRAIRYQLLSAEVGRPDISTAGRNLRKQGGRPYPDVRTMSRTPDIVEALPLRLAQHDGFEVMTG